VSPAIFTARSYIVGKSFSSTPSARTRRPKSSHQPRSYAKNIGTKSPYDRVVRPQHRNPRGEEDESGHHRYQCANDTQDQQAHAENGANDMAHDVEGSVITLSVPGLYHDRA